MTGKEAVSTDKAPKAVGPYSQAIKANGFVFVSGCVPINPTTQEVFHGDVAAQTELVLSNLTAVLEAAGSSIDKVVRTTVFIKDMNDFATINGVYAKTFTGVTPARACVEVARLPKDVLVEIDCIALA
eukprot:comp12251_c0_seq1/m.7048 comp12251_c0_seq1/g.7048  ORF comp12251_c0_seq1/g.7048 comp12251_c0_seq1/m.7048 type:complete len:128 (-) comp12251_c0_seq1:319-702(-)